MEYSKKKTTPSVLYTVDFTELSALPSEWTAVAGGTVVSGSGLAADSLVCKAIDLSSVNKLIYTVTGMRVHSTSRPGWDTIGLTDKTGSSGSIDIWNGYRFFAPYNSNYSYADTGTRLEQITGSPTYTLLSKDSGGTEPGPGAYEYILSIDFNTGEMKGTQNNGGPGGTVKEATYTLNSSQISDIKSLGYVFIMVYRPNGVTNHCRTATIEIS